jgi:transcription elongation factor GreA
MGRPELIQRRIEMSYLLDKPLPFTREGKDELAREVAIVAAYREEILAELKDAPEGTEGHLLRELESVGAQLCRLRRTLSVGVPVVNAGLVVAVGSEVTLAEGQDTLTLTIAGPIAANPSRSCVSYDSPLGRALLGAELGEYVEIPSGGSHRRVKVVGIRRGSPAHASGAVVRPEQLVATG